MLHRPARSRWLPVVRTVQFLILAALFLALTGAAAAAPVYQNPEEEPPPSITNGRIFWDGLCQPCHGLAGRGDGPDAAELDFPPADFSDPGTARQLAPADAFETIKNGRLANSMPAWEEDLSDANIWDTVSYIWTFGTSPGALSAGETVFLDECAACHGESGMGDGLDASAEMLDFTDHEAMLQQSQGDLMAQYAASDQHADLGHLSKESLWQTLDYIRTFIFTVPTRDGVQTGQVINATTGEPQGDIQVFLHMMQGESEELLTLATFADEDGRYTFDKLPVDPAFRYIVEAVHEEIGYLGEAPAVFSAGALESAVDVMVYDTSDNDTNLYISQVQLLLSFTPEAVNVMQVYTIGNDGDTTYVGEDGRTFAFRLPAGATDVVFQNDMGGERFIQTDSGYVDTEPIMPSAEGLSIYSLYDIPVVDGNLTIELPFPVGAKSVDVLVNEQGVILSSDRLTPAETREFRGSTFVRFHGEDFAAGDVLKLGLSELGNVELAAQELAAQEEAAEGAGLLDLNLLEDGIDQGMWRWLIVILGGLVLVAGVVLYPVMRSRQTSSAEPEEVDLAARRQKLLLLLAELDEANEAGEIDPAVYEKASARYRVELAEVIERM